MHKHQKPTTAQLRHDIDTVRTGSKVAASDPAAAPLGSDDEAAGTPPTADRIEMARAAEKKIGEATREAGEPNSSAKADDKAQEQRDSSAPYAKEDHMNQELVKQADREDMA